MDLFECAVCYNQLRDPRVVPCGHTFCKSCLSKLKTNQLYCPLCRTAFTSVDSLAPNWVVVQWMEQSKDQSKVKKKEILCGNCEEPATATYFCENCEAHLCGICETKLHATRVTKNHIRLTLKEKSKKPTFSKCSKHHKDKEFYCKDDQLFLCHVCVIDDHKPHNTISVYKYTDALRDELKEFVAPLQNRQLLERKEIDFRNNKEKKVTEVMTLEARVRILKDEINQIDVEITHVTQQQEKVKTSEVVLIKAIEEVSVAELMDRDKVDAMRSRIKEVVGQIFPEKERIFILNTISAPTQIGSCVHTQGRVLIDLQLQNPRYIYDGYGYGHNSTLMQIENPQAISIPDGKIPGIGIAMFNKHFYFPIYTTNTIIKCDSNHIVQTYTFPDIDGRSSYDWGGYSGTVFHVDECGLWLTSIKKDHYIIKKIDPDTLQPIQTWNAPHNNNRGGSFMICGILYMIPKYNTIQCSILSAFNTHTSSHLTLNIPFSMEGYHSSSTYVPSEKALYCVDNSKILKYDLTLQPMV